MSIMWFVFVVSYLGMGFMMTRGAFESIKKDTKKTQTEYHALKNEVFFTALVTLIWFPLLFILMLKKKD